MKGNNPQEKGARQKRRARNLVAKNNKHKGGYHTSNKYDRKYNNDWYDQEDILMESGYYD